MGEKTRVDDDWQAGTFAGAEEAQLRAALKATPGQRLAWLEEAMQFAYAAQKRLTPESDRLLRGPEQFDPAGERDEGQRPTPSD